MVERESNSRKRTRSAKGLAFDEMTNAKVKSPSVKQARLVGKTNKSLVKESKVSNKIVFKGNNGIQEETSDKNQVNNNSNVSNRNTKAKKFPDKVKVKQKILDLCFKNVWRKELNKETKAKLGKVRAKEISNSKSVLQEADIEVDVRDGINLDVEGGPEDLDYVDDIIDEDLSDFKEVETLENVTEPTGIVDSRLPRATGSSGNKIPVQGAQNKCKCWAQHLRETLVHHPLLTKQRS